MIVDKTLAEIAELISGRVAGDATLRMQRLAPIGDAGAHDLSFVDRGHYVKAINKTSASALIVSRNLAVTFPHIIWVENASRAVSALCASLTKSDVTSTTIHATAIIGTNSSLDTSVHVGPYVVIGDRVRIGADCIIHAHAFIGDNVTIGKNTIIHPRASILANTVIGDHVIIHSGAVIGSAGFGFVDAKRVPQCGIVRIGDRVEIGANTTIDRARIGETRIGDNTKIDNQVQIGHGAIVGRDVIMCGQTGIAGSARIGDRAVLGGRSAVIDHVHIASDVILGVHTIVTGNVDAAGNYLGIGPLPAMTYRRAHTIFNQLPKLYRDVQRLSTICDESKNT